MKFFIKTCVSLLKLVVTLLGLVAIIGTLASIPGLVAAIWSKDVEAILMWFGFLSISVLIFLGAIKTLKKYPPT